MARSKSPPPPSPLPAEEVPEERSDPIRGFMNVSDYNHYIATGEMYHSLSIPPTVLDPGRAHTFDAKTRAVYLRALATCGVQYMAARVAGVGIQTINTHMRSDREFAAEVAAAMDHYRSRIENEFNAQALQGVWEPIVGRVGRDQDGVVGYKLVKRFEALKMLAMRHIPAFRTQGPGGGGGGGRTGVLVVNQIRPVQEWIEATEGERLPRDPLHGIPGAEGLLLDEGSEGRRSMLEEDS